MPNVNVLRYLLVVVLVMPLSCKAVRADVQATVIKVVDGDTLDVRIGGRKKRVRLIGVDTSELHESDKLIRDAARSRCSEADLQHLGAVATEFVTNLLAPGDTVRLEYAGKRYDDYRRLLAFVWLPDGQLLNELLICEGYAQARPRYVSPPEYRGRFQQCALEAQAESKGLWAAGCWTAARQSPRTPAQHREGGGVRGNRKSRVYHLPECPHYGRLRASNIVEFASEAEAQEAGYRKAKNCPD
ncbi:MAG: thermonuclease family protein [Candidatus Binatia bacterium]